jgi:hypothetical protein
MADTCGRVHDVTIEGPERVVRAAYAEAVDLAGWVLRYAHAAGCDCAAVVTVRVEPPSVPFTPVHDAAGATLDPRVDHEPGCAMDDAALARILAHVGRAASAELN